MSTVTFSSFLSSLPLKKLTTMSISSIVAILDIYMVFRSSALSLEHRITTLAAITSRLRDHTHPYGTVRSRLSPSNITCSRQCLLSLEVSKPYRWLVIGACVVPHIIIIVVILVLESPVTIWLIAFSFSNFLSHWQTLSERQLHATLENKVHKYKKVQARNSNGYSTRKFVLLSFYFILILPAPRSAHQHRL